jgi:hypothetical protein
MNETPQETSGITLGTIILSKVLDENGNIGIEIDTDEELAAYETIGMLTIALQQAKKDAEYEYDYEEEE